jgi:poly-gamma-glutamate synthesis protein (capsule biosynthesis protein)
LVTSDIPADTYPNFATPAQLGDAAYEAGFRVFALSNNHSYDKGARGITSSLDYWENAPQDVVSYGFYDADSSEESEIALQKKNGITIAYVAFTFGTNGIPTPQDAEAVVIYTADEAAMEEKVTLARSLADVVIVSVHWGTENSHTIHDSQRNLGAKFANWGADVIIGTHPHVIQDIEWIESETDGRKVLLIHSLGNFLSAQAQPNQLIGLVVDFEIARTAYPDGTFSPISIENVRALPTVTQYETPSLGYYDNPRTYFLSDYTEELALSHYVRASITSAWGIEYIKDICRQYVSEEFLVL